MQTPLALCSLALVALLSGCATDPRYANTRTQDATTIVESSVSPEKFQSGGGMLVKIEKIDEGIAPKPPLYLAPGFHRLTIQLRDHLNYQAIVRTSIIVGERKSYRVDATKEDQLFTLQIIDVASEETVCTEKIISHYVPNEALGQ